MKDAGGVSVGTDAYLFREGLRTEVRDIALKLGKSADSLEETILTCLRAEEILLKNSKSTNPLKLAATSQAQPQGGGRGRWRGKGGGRGQGGYRERSPNGGGQGGQPQPGYGGPRQGYGGGRGEGRGSGGEGNDGKKVRFGDNPRGKGHGRYNSHSDKPKLHATCTIDEVEGEPTYPNPPTLAGALGGEREELVYIETPDGWRQVPRSQLSRQGR